MFDFLSSFFESDLDNFIKQLNKFQYLHVQNYVEVHSIDDSFPELIDRIHDNSIISLIDLDEFPVLIEILFDDEEYLYRIKQIYKVVQETTEFGPVISVELITDKETLVDVADLIVEKAIKNMFDGLEESRQQ